MNLRITFPLIALALLSSGCQKKAHVVAQKDIQRSQELFITSPETTHKLHQGVFYEMTLSLNNTNATSTDLKLINRGGKPLSIKNIELIDRNEVFTVSSNNCQQKTLEPHEACTIKVAFDSQENRLYNADLRINSNDRRRKVVNIKVLGHSVNKYQGSLSVSEFDDTKNMTRDLQLKFDAINNKQLITVKNDGLYPITLEAPKFLGPNRSSYTFETTCTDTLAVAASCDVSINYDKNVHDGYSIAQLKLPSNSDLTPSNKIRLVGYSKPYFVNISQFVISKNIHDFMGDYFASKQTYYIRTIYQNNINSTFQSNIDDAISSYITDNNYVLATSPDKADRVITLYPNVQVPSIANESETNDMLFNITINGYVSTKADAQGQLKDEKLLKEHISDDMNFTAISSNNIYYNKEAFAFALQIDVDNVSDKYDVYETIAKTLASKMFNVIGLPKQTGK